MKGVGYSGAEAEKHEARDLEAKGDAQGDPEGDAQGQQHEAEFRYDPPRADPADEAIVDGSDLSAAAAPSAAAPGSIVSTNHLRPRERLFSTTGSSSVRALGGLPAREEGVFVR